MQIEISDTSGITTLRLSGEIDLHASPALRAELQKCVHSKISTLLLDFTAVVYIDSSGLATLIEYIRESSSFKGRLALFGLQKKVRTIFDLVRLNELFVISGTAADAIAALAEK